MSDINSMVFGSINFDQLMEESLTPQELEKDGSFSNWTGRLLVLEDSDRIGLVFEVDKQYSYSNFIECYFDKNPGLLMEGESTYGNLSGQKNNFNFDMFEGTHITTGTFKGAGVLTYEHGIDFEFETDIFKGHYHMMEKTGFPGSKITLERS